MSTVVSEKLGLWDRLFNRYRKEVLGRGVMDLKRNGEHVYVYPYVEYTVIDRVTGSTTITREWLNGPPPRPYD